MHNISTAPVAPLGDQDVLGQMPDVASADCSTDERLQRVRVFRLNLYDFWIAYDISSALLDAQARLGLALEDLVDDLAPPYALSDQELEGMVMQTNTGEVLTFAQVMVKHVIDGWPIPGPFANLTDRDN